MKKLILASALCLGSVCAAAEQAPEQPTLQQAGKTAERAVQEARDAVLTPEVKQDAKEIGKKAEAAGRSIGRLFGRKR